MGDSVHHEENDNDKEQGCQNEEQQSHSPEQREIMEPVCVLEVFSKHFTSMEVRPACTSYYRFERLPTKSIMIISTTSQFAVSGKWRGVLF